jgi:hypothetical protein
MTVIELPRTKFGIAICKEAGFEATSTPPSTPVLFPAAPGLHGGRTDEVA